ncbi:MAG: cadmium-translocating P-type ATPase [Anaerolineae bacterium]|nr:cadmium-translocating P-type ATPase [Anaerolineae bacterium]
MSSRTFWIRAGVALCAVAALSLAQWLAQSWLYWAGLVFWAICLGMFARTLLRALFKTHKVTADLLVVTVLLVTLLNGQPLSGVLVAWFISLGLAISLTIIERTRRRIVALTQKRNRHVRVLREGVIKEVLVEEVRLGDIAVVPQGEMIPVDGVIVGSAAMVDESVVTGEPFPMHKMAGEDVLSGSLALSGPVQVKASRAGNKAFLYQMGAEIENALQVKTQTHRTADTIVQCFIPGVVVYGLLILLITGDLGRMATIVSIACPCAWALAVPTAFAAAIGSLARQGILARGGTPLELIGQADTVVLDKTGTMTLAEPRVETVTALTLPREHLVQIAASVEAGFNHPIANAIVAYAVEHNVQPLPVTDADYLPGQGVKAMVKGQQVFLGGTETLQTIGVTLPEQTTLAGRATWIVVDGQVAGMIAMQDVLREATHNLAVDLHKEGIRKVILATGDTEEGEASRVADIIGADAYRWHCTPADKTALVKELKTQGITLMVGDGINDATALAAADVGIAIGGAKADLAIQSSDVIVQREDAASLLTVLRIGKKLRRVITQNYIWALGFNITGIVLATLGILNAPLAAVLHHISSVFVVFNAVRLSRKSFIS